MPQEAPLPVPIFQLAEEEGDPSLPQGSIPIAGNEASKPRVAKIVQRAEGNL
jgi:hypothetical protein